MEQKQVLTLKDAGVELFFDGLKKFETISDGVAVTGTLETTTIEVPDGTSGIQVGNSNDLRLRHDGTDSRIINYNSDLYIYTTGQYAVRILADSQNAVLCLPDAAVELYYDNSKKLETTSTGVEVSGDLIIDDAAKSISIGDVTNDNFTNIKHEIAANAGDAIRGFVAQNNNASLVENLQGSTNQFLVLGDTDDLSADTLFGVSVVRSGTTRARLTLSGTGNLTVPGRVTCDDLSFIPSGTKMLFQQTAAPSGWTKVTSGVNNSALRVVHGTAGSGGSNGFTNVFNSDVTTSGGSVASHTLTTSQIPSHNHSIQIRTGRDDDNFSFNQGFSSDANTSGGTFNSNSTGGGQGHSHNFNHPSFNLNVAYTDVIICTKD